MVELHSLEVGPAAAPGVGFGVAVTPLAWGKGVSSYLGVANLQIMHRFYLKATRLQNKGFLPLQVTFPLPFANCSHMTYLLQYYHLPPAT